MCRKIFYESLQKKIITNATKYQEISRHSCDGILTNLTLTLGELLASFLWWDANINIIIHPVHKMEWSHILLPLWHVDKTPSCVDGGVLQWEVDPPRVDHPAPPTWLAQLLAPASVISSSPTPQPGVLPSSPPLLFPSSPPPPSHPFPPSTSSSPPFTSSNQNAQPGVLPVWL